MTDPGAGSGPGGDGRAYERYAELHAHSHYSFLDGASSPEELVEEAARLGLEGLALTDHDGLHGAVKLAEAARTRPGLATVYGAELSLALGEPRTGSPDPAAEHLVVLARGVEGYHALSGALTAGLLAGGEKGRPAYVLEELAARGRDRWAVLTGCRKGAVRTALADGVGAAGCALDRLVDLFGRENVFVELFDHGNPRDTVDNDALAGLAAARGCETVATNNVHHARPDGDRIASVLAAVRSGRSLDRLDPWLPATGGAHLRSGAEMAARFRRHPRAPAAAARLAAECSFELRAIRPALPRCAVPAGHTRMSWLRELVFRGAAERYPRADDAVRARLERELAVIEAKDFPGYFLIVHDLVSFARSRGILCQGRGSAANSAVCYVLGITAVDAIAFDLPFERFLSSLREEEPDIDVDFESGRREEVIQYVYDTYGRFNAAQVADVITYRTRSAVRDVAAVFGYAPGTRDAFARAVSRGASVAEGEAPEGVPAEVLGFASALRHAPRHLGIHSGGMVLTARPVGEICPIEPARKQARTVLQWDKEDCAAMGLVKFDLLGLGMLSAIQNVLDLVEARLGRRWTPADIPKEEAGVYDMLCRGDAIGVFQVESRAQLNTLPRLRPRSFYDLAVEIALIRPGPIQGDAVHPYLRRRSGKEPVTYPHPLLEPVLERTLGVPLFQEQVMQMAAAVGGCSAEDADLLRRAMSSKRGRERIEVLRRKLYEGMAAHGIRGDLADDLYSRIEAFAGYGFAESHSLSFALLVYVSSWLKLHYPGAFLAGLLRAQPMGFYSPASLVADARRHGVEVRGVDLARSGLDADLERAGAGPADSGRPACLDAVQPPVGPFDPEAGDETAAHRRDASFAVRLGLGAVRRLRAVTARRIVAERELGMFADPEDVARRTGANAAELEALAAAGALAPLGVGRREGVWVAGRAARERPDQLEGTRVLVQPPLLPELGEAGCVAYDLWATGISPDDHPLRLLREALSARGVSSVAALRSAEPGRRIEVAGLVTHRQRPSAAGGVTFLNIEDETGIVGIVASIGVWRHHRRVAAASPALSVRGILQRTPEGVISVVADRFEPLDAGVPSSSRDFR